MLPKLSSLSLIISVVVSYSQASDKPSSPLFQIIENNKSGYINSRGEVVIKPIYRTSGEFSEGLAEARINGTYGYIDQTGNFVIQPQFDFATAFSEGLAIVYKEGKPFFIDTKGGQAFTCSFAGVGPFKNGRALVKTASKKYGVIDKQGKLFIDTIYTRINKFVDGLAVVEGMNHQTHPDEEKGIKVSLEIGVMDSLGHFVIPFGVFEEIDDFDGEHFTAKIPPNSYERVDGWFPSSTDAILDRTGQVIVSYKYTDGGYLNGNLHCGLVKMYLPQPDDAGHSRQGYLNIKGEIAINDTTFETVEDFAENRAFVRDGDWHYSIINTEGKFIANKAYSRISGDGFKKGVAFVKVDSKWGLIDTNANFIIQPKFDGIEEIGIVDGCFFFTERNPVEDAEFDDLIGIAKSDGSILLKPVIQKMYSYGFSDGLLCCLIDGKLTYINTDGKTVWQASGSKSKALSNLNIDFMNRGYFYAISKPHKKDIGGFGHSKNIARKVSKGNNFQPNALSVSVRPEIRDTIYSSCNGITVFVANCLKKEIKFNAQDSRLYMKVQALDSKNEWMDIEYLPSSWCGNSYHTLTLEPKHFWSFLSPVYEGDLKTKLRIELRYLDPNDRSEKSWEKKEVTLYSNEFDGSINPGQFWRKRDYYPNGIMDPYND